jgi:UDP-glucose 4-epimerase
VIHSTGEQKRNFVATDDIASVIERFLARSESPAELMNPVGPETLSVYEFALRCAASFEAITGERCAVERKPPDAQPVPEASFEFSSVYEHAKGSTTIDGFLSEMIRALIQNTHQEISNGSFSTAR